MVDIGFHPLEVKKGIEIASNTFIQYLENMKKVIVNKKELHNLAMITTNRDTNVSDIVSEAIFQLGVDGLIEIEESPTGLTELLILEGMSILNGYVSKEFTNNDEPR